mmetsp:Transcript_81533/g.253151  ORF Transcript_81533/g.253151 Transcript_81533/m.253151 type:complete len:203 (+) Transcript_81533:363-971(+)
MRTRPWSSGIWACRRGQGSGGETRTSGRGRRRPRGCLGSRNGSARRPRGGAGRTWPGRGRRRSSGGARGRRCWGQRGPWRQTAKRALPRRPRRRRPSRQQQRRPLSPRRLQSRSRSSPLDGCGLKGVWMPSGKWRGRTATRRRAPRSRRSISGGSGPTIQRWTTYRSLRWASSATAGQPRLQLQLLQRRPPQSRSRSPPCAW